MPQHYLELQHRRTHAGHSAVKPFSPEAGECWIEISSPRKYIIIAPRTIFPEKTCRGTEIAQEY